MDKLQILLSTLLLFGVVASSPPLQVDLSSPFEDFYSGPSPSLFAGVRISQDVVPVHYDLQIIPIVNLPVNDPQQFTAPGNVTIRLNVINPTDNITLHSNDIDIDAPNIQLVIVGTSISIRILSQSANPTMSTYTLILGEQLSTNLQYDLIIPFVAKVGNRLSGLYRSSYLDSTGTQKWLATTQFQKLGARMAFPCFDEPNFKATFNITIGRPQGYNTLSNGAIFETFPIPGMEGWFWDVHARTVQMSSYLIAMVVSDFVSVSASPDLSNYDVKVWGPPTMTNNATAGFAATSAAQIVTYFENYLQSTYQFPKLDSAAIPDFSAGAMENWALNTYRLTYLLFFDGESTQNEKWGIARVFAHEISHHWFGDLVTCDWWNDLWLNEGFASYMELLAENATGFDVEAMERYPLDKFQSAMAFDVGPTSEPVRSNDSTIVNSQASTIIYQKAASLIRMMQGFLTEETFIGGIRNYLDTHAYGNTIQDNLFAELQSQADLDGTLTDYTVKEVMDTWTLQTGFPIVQATWFPDRVLFRHEKFSLNPPAWNPDATQEAGTWYTPIAYTQGSNSDFSEESWKPKFWFEPGTQNQTFVLDLATDEWIILNPDARSYFRTIYCSHFLGLILTQLETDHTVISANTRGQLIDDYFKVVPTKGWENAQIGNAMDLTKYLSNEVSTAVWITVFNNLRPINRNLIDAPFYASFKEYLLSKISPVLYRISWGGGEDAPKTVILRSQLLDWACAFGASECNALTETYAYILATTGTGIPADIQPVIFCKAVGISESLNLPDQFNIKGYLLQQYMNASTRAERLSIFYNALACDSLEFVEGWLDLATSPTSPFTNAHAISVMQRLGENPVNRELIISYFSANIARIISARGESAISNVVSSIAAYTWDATIGTKVNEFIDLALDTVSGGNIRTSLLASRTAMANNAAWFADYGVKIGNWLSTK